MTIAERAFSLAQSGGFRSLTELEKQLYREGYPSVAEHFRSGTLRKQLKAIIASTSKPMSAAELSAKDCVGPGAPEVVAADEGLSASV